MFHYSSNEKFSGEWKVNFRKTKVEEKVMLEAVEGHRHKPGGVLKKKIKTISKVFSVGRMFVIVLENLRKREDLNCISSYGKQLQGLSILKNNFDILDKRQHKIVITERQLFDLFFLSKISKNIQWRKCNLFHKQ